VRYGRSPRNCAVASARSIRDVATLIAGGVGVAILATTHAHASPAVVEISDVQSAFPG
jgi:hypothetical protein